MEAYDRTKRTKCAIKVIRSVQKYRDASKIELRVLATLSCNDKENKNKCIHLRDCFDFKNHICQQYPLEFTTTSITLLMNLC